jgi:DNA-binding transcriptional regulator GbsR (MarR family)
MADATAAEDALSGAVGATGSRFVLHWGEMGTRWGLSRTVAQIHALLFLTGRPLHAEAIAEVLQVARSNVSGSLRELQNWDLVKVVHLAGDRRDHFETSQDPWELMRIIVRERKERELEPTVVFLRGCVASRDFAREDAQAQKRLREALALAENLSAWADEMLGLETPVMKKLLRLGARVQALLR